MTAPRLIRQGMTFYLTVRATNRSFRFVPTRSVVESVRYALAVVSERYRSDGRLVLHEFCFMSNHFHILGTDHGACAPDFLRDLDSLLSRQLNALRGIRGSNIEKGAGILEVQAPERIIEHAIYTLANPVAAFLVAKARKWPGLHSLRMDYGCPITVEQPRLGLWARKATQPRGAAVRSGRARFWGRTTLPPRALLVIDRPAILPELTDRALRERIREGLREREGTIAVQRHKRGQRVLGLKAIRSAHYLQVPNSEELFARNPTFSASSREERQRLASHYRRYCRRYRQATRALFAGDLQVVFPEGTYLWRCRFGVTCLPLSSA